MRSKLRTSLSLAITTLLAGAVPSHAQMVTQVQPYAFTALGCGQLTSLGSAAGFGSLPSGTTLVVITVEGQPVRMRDDGVNPTASVGLLLPVGGPWPYTPLNSSAAKFIQTAASATIDYCAYK